MVLSNLISLPDGRLIKIGIHGEKISAVELTDSTRDQYTREIHFSDAFVIPGLINSHDHLDFNCFCLPGHRKFNNYKEWAGHIHRRYKEEILQVLRIPEEYRILWGIYKNLLAGVTTVVNHGATLELKNPLIHVVQKTQDLHSVGFEKLWKWKLNNPLFKNKVCVIHIGEGWDEISFNEISEVINYNLIKRELVGVHGVAMNKIQAEGFKGLVWCPESNRYMFNQHASIELLKKSTEIVFGSDSTLTGRWNIWQHLRLARSLKKTTDPELFEMITSGAARLWNLNSGLIESAKDADLVILKIKKGESVWDGLFQSNPEDILMVMHKGKPRLFDKSLLSQFQEMDLTNFSQVRINDSIKFVEGNLPGLISRIKSFHPDIRFPLRDSEQFLSPTPV